MQPEFKIREYEDGSFEVIKLNGGASYEPIVQSRFYSFETAKRWVKSQTVKTIHEVDIKE